MHSETARKC